MIFHFLTGSEIISAVTCFLEQLGKKLTDDYASKPPLILCVLKGGSVSMADIVRSIKDCKVSRPFFTILL